MINPMFMIVQNLGAFLIAVTAVTSKLLYMYKNEFVNLCFNVPM